MSAQELTPEIDEGCRGNAGIAPNSLIAPIHELPNSPANPPRKSRGGQAGNRNALKHGFYSRQFKKREASDLDESQTISLGDEIAMLRVFLRRLLEQSQSVDDIYDLISILRVLSFATISLTRLIRAEHWLSRAGKHTEIEDAVEQAIKQLMQEMDLQV